MEGGIGYQLINWDLRPNVNTYDFAALRPRQKLILGQNTNLCFYVYVLCFSVLGNAPMHDRS
jgi:hypothetical protein